MSTTLFEQTCKGCEQLAPLLNKAIINASHNHLLITKKGQLHLYHVCVLFSSVNSVDIRSFQRMADFPVCHLSAHLISFACLSSVCLTDVCVSTWRSICLSAFLSVCLSVISDRETETERQRETKRAPPPMEFITVKEK